MKLSKITFLLVLTLLLYTTEIFASSCVPPTLEKAVEDADVIIKGKVTEVDYGNPRTASLIPDPERITGKCGDKHLTIAIEKKWKGKLINENKITVFSWDGCVGLGGYFTEGDEGIYFIKEDQEHLRYNIWVCSKPSGEVTEEQLDSILNNERS